MLHPRQINSLIHDVDANAVGDCALHLAAVAAQQVGDPLCELLTHDLQKTDDVPTILIKRIPLCQRPSSHALNNLLAFSLAALGGLFLLYLFHLCDN